MIGAPEAVLFDFDGTLVHITIDFEAMRQNALDVIARYGETPDGGKWTLEIIEAVRDRLARQEPVTANRFQREALASIEAVELDAAARATPLPAAVETLDWLRREGIGIGIVTRNCRNAVLRVISRHGLHVDALFTRDDVRYVKPHPGQLLAALGFLRALPGESLMVGDHPTDIAGAHAAGLAGVALTTTRAAAEFDGDTDHIISGLDELPPLIASGRWRRAAKELERP